MSLSLRGTAQKLQLYLGFMFREVEINPRKATVARFGKKESFGFGLNVGTNENCLNIKQSVATKFYLSKGKGDNGAIRSQSFIKWFNGN